MTVLLSNVISKKPLFLFFLWAEKTKNLILATFKPLLK